MKQFVDEGYLINASSYTKKGNGTEETFYKYTFLVGDQDGTYLQNATLQVCTSKTPLLIGNEKFMSKIKVLVEIRTEFEKDGSGKYRQVQRPVYTVAEVRPKAE